MNYINYAIRNPNFFKYFTRFFYYLMKFKKFKFKKVKSTNNTAIRIIKKTKYNLGMVVAETQINGRGQYGRKWISSKGNLFISFFNELNKTKLSINAITKINCLLVKKLLSSFTSKF